MFGVPLRRPCATEASYFGQKFKVHNGYHRMARSGVPFLLVCWCWCFAVAGDKYQQLVLENQQKISKIPANPVFSIFFRKNIFKILFFIKYLLLSHLGTKQNFYFDVLLVPVGTEKKPFLIENGKNSKFSIFLGPIFPNN